MKFKKNTMVRISCKKKDLMEIGMTERDAAKSQNRVGVITGVWGENENKYNVKIPTVTNNGYDYALDEWMLSKLN